MIPLLVADASLSDILLWENASKYKKYHFEYNQIERKKREKNTNEHNKIEHVHANYCITYSSWRGFLCANARCDCFFVLFLK